MLGAGAAAISPHLEQTLEDEFLELEPAQVRAALRQAGGCLQRARTLCARLAAHQQARPAAAAAPLSVSPGPAYPQQQRHWWPRSEFCSRTSSSSSSATKSVPAPARSASSSISAPGSFQRPRLVPHQVLPLPAQRSAPKQQQAMQSPGAASSQRAVPATSSSRQSPATVALRRILGSPAAGIGPGAGGSAQQASSPSAASTAAASASSSGSAAPASSPAPPTPAAGFPPVRPAQQAAQRQQQAEPPLHPHYAAVFLADKSRQQLLQHVPPLHEQVSGDHMTMAYKPSLAQCLQLPLGRDAALFVVGAAADYRAQAVAVQHPTWVPFLSESTPHVTISVADGVPAKEAGDMMAAALAVGQVSPVARLKLLQGTVGVQLSDGSRVFSAEDLQAALAAATRRQQAVAARAAPAGPVRILPRGAATPSMPAAHAVPQAEPAEPATEPAVPAALPAPAAAASGGGAGAGGKPPIKAATWDLDALLDQLHMAEQHSAGAAAPALPAPPRPQQAQQAQQAPPRRGLLKLPTAVAAEMAAPSSSPAAPRSAGPAVLAVSRTQRRPPPPQHQQQQQPQAWEQATATTGGGIEWAEPEAPAVRGKSVAEEAAEAAAGEEPLDLVSSLAHLLPAGSTPGAPSSAAMPRAEPPLPSPTVLSGLGVAATASSGAEAGASGYETSSSSGSAALGDEGSDGLGGGGAAAAPLDPESQNLLQLQFPELHHLVIDTALRMHGGSLPAAAQFLAVLDQQQQQLGLGPAGGEGRTPQQPTLGSFLQGVLPELAEPAAPAYDLPPSSAGSYADSAGDWAGGRGRAQAVPLAQQQQRRSSLGAGTLPGRGWQQQQQQQGGGGRGRGKAARRPTAGDDPMSVTERQAMNLHLSAKRLYTQAAQEAFASGQVGLGKELQATARSHADAASAARRRANASAFRSTNASVTNTFTLDLHGQHVDEALASLERYLVTLGGLGHPGGVLLQVITGVGRHSHGNQPRILPAVVRYLSDAGYKFDSDEANPGVIHVSIGV